MDGNAPPPRGAAVQTWMDGDRARPLRVSAAEAPCLCEGRWARSRLGRATIWRSALAWCARHAPTSTLRVALYRLAGAHIGRGVFLSPGAMLDPLFPQLVRLGDEVMLGMGARVITHEYTANAFRIGQTTVEAGAVIGGWATVRAGVTVGAGATVGLMSFAVRDVPPGAVVSGVPAVALSSKKPEHD